MAKKNETTCSICGGSGGVTKTCGTCLGKGCNICNQSGTISVTCPYCNGRGKVDG